MDPALELESKRLAQSWLQHDAARLRDYLVAGVEDPRINLQSILSRHFLLRVLAPGDCAPLMEEEYRFAAALNWLVQLAGRAADNQELLEVLHALRRGGDNAEGIEIPAFVGRTFARLPVHASGVTVPNYIEAFLSGARIGSPQAQPHQPSLDTFRDLWRNVLAGRGGAGVRPSSGEAASPAGSAVEHPSGPAVSVLEPACGSANDYRFLEAYGIAQRIEYHGFDLCATSVENARALFPGVRFGIGNVFEIAAPDKRFDFCFVHDLFEHLSPAGIQAAVKEVCRVTRRGLCVGFFHMDEIPAHQVRPLRDYYWNTLSMARMKELFAACGFDARALHIGAFLRSHTGCDQTHNPLAYTFIARRA